MSRIKIWPEVINDMVKKNRNVFFVMFSMFLFAYLQVKTYKKEKQRKIRNRKITEKDNLIIETLIHWLQIEHEGKSLSMLLKEMGYDEIGIYGYGYLGKELEKILIDDGLLKIICVIDKNLKHRNNGEKIVSPDSSLPDMDAIIVTSSYYFEEIETDLKNLNLKADILSIDALVYQL